MPDWLVWLIGAIAVAMIVVGLATAYADRRGADEAEEDLSPGSTFIRSRGTKGLSSEGDRSTADVFLDSEGDSDVSVRDADHNPQARVE